MLRPEVVHLLTFKMICALLLLRQQSGHAIRTEDAFYIRGEVSSRTQTNPVTFVLELRHTII